uniref:DNA-directed DNA polymerase family A palm domain-containing protein n=1 Tax=Odontella aurita TaxID=265563 RepID=A0A7S4JPM5_9STRA
MPWYEPVASPPDPPCYQDFSTRTGHHDRSHHNERRERTSGSSIADFGAWGGDELQRRLEALISPMLSSAELASEKYRTEEATTPFSGSAVAQHGSFQSPCPHPSFRHREKPPSTPEDNIGEAAMFFYPHAMPGGRKFLSPVDSEVALSPAIMRRAESCSSRAGREDVSSLQLQGMNTTDKIDGGNRKTDSGGEMLGNDDGRCIVNDRPNEKGMSGNDPSQYLGGEVPNNYDNSQYGDTYRPQKGTSKQMTLALEPNSGGLFCSPPQEKRSGGEQSWEDVGKIGRYQAQQTENDTKCSSKQRKKKKKKKENARKNKGRTDCSDDRHGIFAALRSGESAHNGQHSGFESEANSKTKEKAKKRTRTTGNESRKPSIPDALGDDNVIDEASFEGIEECEFMNAGTSDESLELFLSKVKSKRVVAWTMVFLDGDCTTPFLPTSKKYCTQKGPRCTMWNCICDGQIRAMQASAPVLGAMISVPLPSEGEPNANAETYILPLGPALNLDSVPGLTTGFERMTSWPVAPFLCGTSLRQRWNAFRSILIDRHVTKVTYCAELGLMPFHFHRMQDVEGGRADASHAQLDLILPGIWDLRLASWVLLPHSKDSDLEFETMRNGFPHLVDKIPKHPKPDNVSTQLHGLISAREDLELLLVLHPIIGRQISDKGLRAAFDDIESPLQSVLSAMECTGIGVRPSRLPKQAVEQKIEKLTTEAQSVSKDNTFLLSSPQQVSHLLFDIMGITVPKGLSTKQVAGSQHRSTSEESLKAIQTEAKKKGNNYRIIDIILEFRTLNKMLTTYIRPLPNFARELAPKSKSRGKRRKRSKQQSKDDKSKSLRIHPMWMQTAVRTGRLSCRKPNMQQIPTDSVLGVNPRDSFTVSSRKKCLVTADYSQKEIRILAHMSNDDTLINMFRSKDEVDIYKAMASACCGKPVHSVSGEERSIYKQVTLAVLYGMGVTQVAKKLNVNRSTAQKFLNSFFRRFQGVRRWIEATKEFARRHQFVTTISGRRRYLDDICSSDNGKRAQAERQAVNTIIQGSAADIMKLAMLKMSSRIMDWKKECLDSPGGSVVPPMILLQIHDELLFETNANEIDVKMLRDAIMRCCAEECVREFNLKVQLKLKCMYGMSWGSMEELK